MPPVIKTDYTHHQFVRYLLNKMNFNHKIIQITGVKGKTTVTTLINNVFSNFNTLCLTSDSLKYNKEILIKKLSITPASIITAVNKAKELDLLNSIDYCIFEVSLGVIPNTYINVLTNILEDYPIAKQSSHASIAKESVFSSEHTLCDYDSFVEYYSDYENVITLSFNNKNADIYSEDINYGIENTSFILNYFNDKIKFNQFALSDFYINNLMFAISAGLLVNIDVPDIISNLNNSNSILGRNSYTKINDKLIIEDINPGLNTSSIKKCVDNLEKFNEDYIIILGGDYGITCEEIDEKQLSDYINKSQKNFILTGELGKHLETKLENKFLYFNKLNEALNYCIEQEKQKLIQIVYRNEYNSNNVELLKLTNTNN